MSTERYPGEIADLRKFVRAVRALNDEFSLYGDVPCDRIDELLDALEDQS